MIHQTFTSDGGPDVARAHLPKLRTALKALKLDGLLVPHEDEYQNEYLPACAERLLWATGFSGSAGAALVLLDTCILLVDGRYTLQAASETDPKLITIEDLVSFGLPRAIGQFGKPNTRIGYDPKLHAPDALGRLTEAAEAAGVTLVPLAENPIDQAWKNRPAAPASPVTLQPLAVAGEAAASKRQRLGAELGQAGLDAMLLTSPTSLAWLLNVRATDVARSPLPLSQAVLHKDGRVDWFIAPDRLSADVRTDLGNEVAVFEPDTFATHLASFAKAVIGVDFSSASAWHVDVLESAGAKVVRRADPCVLPRACKNASEVEGARQAHIRDGAAIARYLHWLDTEAQSGKVDEIAAVEKLEAFRIATGQLRDLSFDTISGAGPNGAIVHYRVTKGTNRKLKRGSLFLVDSGGQYQDGTTDITRTVPIGRPTPWMRQCFTRVLKGHIALARVRFPAGTTGHALDALARAALWNDGLDYDHGTGHGVGSYLGVHEGPHRISKSATGAALQPGMIVSNEPGYYETDAFGIRIENLQVVSAADSPAPPRRAMLSFETLTLAPIHRSLIVRDMLDREEKAWLNAYHARVFATIGPLIEPDIRAWLEDACMGV